jgi:hypothetical protein
MTTHVVYKEKHGHELQDSSRCGRTDAPPPIEFVGITKN